MSHVHITAEDAGIDTDEGRYVLKVWADDGTEYTIDIHSFVDKFYAAVQTEIRPYILEAEHAKATMPLDTPDTVYELDDPKHPTFFERMVD